MKSIAGCAFLLALSGTCLAQGEDLPPPTPHQRLAVVEELPAVPRPSPWVLYTHNRPECCGPMGGDGPITWDLYVRTGPSLPTAGGTLADTVQTGWLWSAGGRSLLYNVDQTTAWVIDLGISHTYNNGNRPDIQFAIPDVFEVLPGLTFDIVKAASVRALHRTFANLSIGREYYLVGTASDGRWCWRSGWDIGGRLGAARLELNTQFRDPLSNDTVLGFQRLGSEVGGLFAALHSDLEFPRGGCIWNAGFRCEIDETCTDFEHTNANQVWDVNFLMTFGVRF